MNVILILLTLTYSFYFVQIAAPAIGILAILTQVILLVAANKLPSSPFTIYVFKFLVFVVITDFIIISFNTEHEILINRIILWPALILLSLLAAGFVNKSPSHLLNKTFYIVILIVCLCAIIQSVVFFGLGIHIDYIGPLTGEQSRNIAPGANFFSTGMGFRASGFFTEPGNLGTALSYLYFIYKLTIDKNTKFQRNILVRILVYTTFLLTFSLFTLVWMFVHIVHDLFSLKMKNLTRVSLIFIFLVLTLPIINYAFFRLTNPIYAVAAFAQINGILSYISSLSYNEIIFGVTHLRDLRFESDIVLGDGSFVLFELASLGIIRSILLYLIFFYIFLNTKHKLSLACFIFILSAGKYNLANYWLFYLLFIYLNILYERDKVIR